MAKNNQCIFEGNLTRDLEIISTASGFRIGKVGIAINDRRKQGEEWVDVKGSPYFIDLEILGDKLDAFEEVAKKGVKVRVETQLRIDSWEDKATGAKRTKPVFKIWEFEVLEKKEYEEKPKQAQKPQVKAGKTKASTTPKADDVPF